MTYRIVHHNGVATETTYVVEADSFEEAIEQVEIALSEGDDEWLDKHVADSKPKRTRK